MREIRIHGRGGQGVKTVAQLIGRAAYLAGFQIQDFAIYGAERRGAPLVSFVRYDKEHILMRGYIPEPDIIIIIDSTVPMEECLRGRRDGTPVLLNSPEQKSGFITLDAMGIALSVLKKPIPNTTMAGASLRFLPDISLKNLTDAIGIEFEGMPAKVIELNQAAARKGYEAVQAPALQKSAREAEVRQP